MESVPRAGVRSLNGDTPGRGVPRLAFDAVILAGGRSSRLGGVPKSSLVFEGSTLLARTLAAVEAAGRVVVVGPRDGQPADPADAARAAGGIRFVLEEPRFGGPVAALGAGIAALGEGPPTADTRPWVAVLAVDVPRAAEALELLRVAAAAEPGADAIVAEDNDGRLQPLLGVYRRAPLERALVELASQGGLADRPVKHLIARLAVQPLRLPSGLVDDVDTWPAAERWGIRRPEGPGTPSTAEEPEMSESAPESGNAAQPNTVQPATAQPGQSDVDAVLRAWSAELADALELGELEVDIDAVLGLAGVAAHAIVRPAAPLTTFLAAYAAGYAAGSGQATERAAMESAIDVARRLAKSRAQQAGTGE
ncbi:NTP transferase domain-containing protein [Sinomonas sp. ASV322]|uniref:NTP transferase domain-containing protein n=1 Tax=Sinomonas sp. ASV322 TaxID=3041920 RepID=UPI0027DD5926|nr:NTP transferase domain-containing protein [Sinomonas sp. ASV322]MDQ4503174.1 NTP transferase domain-containing protein [Sinomonas sp. ASV322]